MQWVRVSVVSRYLGEVRVVSRYLGEVRVRVRVVSRYLGGVRVRVVSRFLGEVRVRVRVVSRYLGEGGHSLGQLRLHLGQSLRLADGLLQLLLSHLQFLLDVPVPLLHLQQTEKNVSTQTHFRLWPA